MGKKTAHIEDRLPTLTVLLCIFSLTLHSTSPAFAHSVLSNDSFKLQLLSHTTSLEIHYISICITANGRRRKKLLDSQQLQDDLEKQLTTILKQ